MLKLQKSPLSRFISFFFPSNSSSPTRTRPLPPRLHPEAPNRSPFPTKPEHFGLRRPDPARSDRPQPAHVSLFIHHAEGRGQAPLVRSRLAPRRRRLRLPGPSRRYTTRPRRRRHTRLQGAFRHRISLLRRCQRYMPRSLFSSSFRSALPLIDGYIRAGYYPVPAPRVP